jgi:hypothetical protein
MIATVGTKNAVQLAAIFGADRKSVQRWRKIDGNPANSSARGVSPAASPRCICFARLLLPVGSEFPPDCITVSVEGDANQAATD